ncbi:dol-P-Man:Man(5)GlcNAc(2)-PP-Dol alpha-1,3-mannosyltransferase [Trichomonascus vanleenenianus]|uniref:dolichyl-P-Man:Man(5)GlcNAc(2)-PP-dolichol alpha-1,3-mannosyltransferase n=1 Tax=Trichomonascus vanleenenianus TaxID=2268995 RepID=UPI003ECA3ECC
MSLVWWMQKGLAAAKDPGYSKYAAALLWLFDLALCAAIILRVPYTEIDWTAYMEQINLIVQGERDYTQIYGGTGPLVYPAGHVFIFSILYDLTDQGADIAKAQWIFMGVYLVTLAVVFAVYVKARLPPYILPLVVLSKRLHSIYLLRMFNDCFATLFAVLAVYLLQLCPQPTAPRQLPSISKILLLSLSMSLFSMAVSVKMSALLYLPGAAIVYLSQLHNVWSCAALLSLPFLIPQVLFALPFLYEFPIEYFVRAFEFSRVFLYQWTVNWRFLDLETFLSVRFAYTLLITHLTILVLFALVPGERFLQPFRAESLVSLFKSIFTSGPQSQPVANYPRYVVTTIALSNLIGMLCARSLHYQFYSWFYWSIPLLLHTSSMPLVVQLLVWGMQEYAWNVFPSTNVSSSMVVVSLVFIITNNWL